MRRFLLGLAVAGMGMAACGKSFTTGPNEGAPCQTVSDCAQRACADVTCEDNHCVATPLPDAPLPPSSQVDGDCRELQCLAGEIVDAVANNDKPVGGSECVDRSCNDGAPVELNVQQGTPCGTGLMLECDGQGSCTGCDGPEDCGEPASVCFEFNCSSSRCEPVVHEGMALPPSDQTTGDCKEKVCNQQGNPVHINDNSNPPDSDGPCSAGSCNEGAPVQVEVGDGDPCIGLGAQVCCGGTCCSAGDICNGTCVLDGTGGGGNGGTGGT